MASLSLVQKQGFRAGNDCHDDKRLRGCMPRAWTQRSNQPEAEVIEFAQRSKRDPVRATQPCLAGLSALTQALMFVDGGRDGSPEPNGAKQRLDEATYLPDSYGC